MNKNINQNKSSLVNFSMEFVKEFATFLHQNGALKFGDFTLSSGKSSSYYIDLRLVSSFPHQFRKMVKNLQDLISEEIKMHQLTDIIEITESLHEASLVSSEILEKIQMQVNQN